MLRIANRLLILFSAFVLTSCIVAPVAKDSSPANARALPSHQTDERGIEGEWEGLIIQGAALTYIKLALTPELQSAASRRYTGKAYALSLEGYLRGHSVTRDINAENIGINVTYDARLRTFHLQSQGRGRGGRLGLHAHLVNLGGVHDLGGGALAGLKQRAFGIRHAPNTGNQYFVFLRPDRFKKVVKTFKRLEKPPGKFARGHSIGILLSRFSGPSAKTLRNWAQLLYDEYPDRDLNRGTYGRFELDTIKLFRDGHFKKYFDKPFDELSTGQLGSIRMAFIKLKKSRDIADRSTSIMERMFYSGRGDNAAKQTALWVVAQRHMLNWHQERLIGLDNLPATKDSMLATDEVEKEIDKIASTLLWPSELKADKQRLASNRKRIALPALKKMLAGFQSTSPSVTLMNRLVNWKSSEKRLFSYLSEGQSRPLLGAAGKRLDSVVEALLPAYRQRISTLGSGLAAVNSGNAWYGDFSSTFALVIQKEKVQDVMRSFKRQRAVHLDQARDKMLVQIRQGYAALPSALSKPADNSRLQYIASLKQSAKKWFAVPGDSGHPTAKAVTKTMDKLGGQATGLLPPRLASRTGFRPIPATATDAPYLSHYRSKVHRIIANRGGLPDDDSLARKYLKKPIRNADFQFNSNIVWALFHGRFDELDSSHYRGQGKGSDIAASWYKTNPRVHYAFVTCAGLASKKDGTRLIGPSGEISWRTTRGGKVEREGWGKIHLPKILYPDYERSYKLAKGASSTDALPSVFLALAKSGLSGMFQKTGMRPDGEFQFACADWEKDIMKDLEQVLGSWPLHSYGVWQLQENILRYLKGRPSLQSLYGYRS